MSDSLRKEDLTTADIARRAAPQPRPEVVYRNPEQTTEDAASPVHSSPGAAVPGPVPVARSNAASAEMSPLFPEDELHNFRARWDQVQTSFVDEPRHAVEQADSL